MDNGAVGGPDLSLYDPFIFFKPAGDDDIRILDGSCCGYFVLDRRLDYDVWLADSPPLDELEWRRGLLGVAFGRTRVDPGRDKLDFGLRQRVVVLKLADAAVREPWRHLPGAYSFFYSFRPRPCLSIRNERHRPDLARTVALLTPLLEDRQHVPVKRYRRIGLSGNGNYARNNLQ